MTYGQLKDLIKKRRATTAIIGLGYVGMPTALALAKAGVRVIGIDINKERVKQINSGKSFIAEILDSELKAAQKKFSATVNFAEIKNAKVIIIAVPTPLTPNKTPDTSYIENAGRNIAKYLRKDALVVLESTTYPGTTEEVLKPILEKSGLIAGKDFYLAFAPERINPGDKSHHFTEIPKVVGGIDQKSTEVAAAFYLTFLKHVHKVSSPRTAEMTKLVENIFRLVNISLANELHLIAAKMGIDYWEVVDAAKTKPYGFMPFYPGPGVGGHCIPLDPFYLSWKAKEYNYFTRFIDLAGEINELMPHQIVTTVNFALNKSAKALRGSKVLVLGVAYKKDIDDPRESPAIPIIWDLVRKGADVSYNDPHISELTIYGHRHAKHPPQTMKSVPLNKELLKKADCVLIVTDHSAYDYAMILREAKLIVDTRHAIKEKSPKVVR